MHAELRRVQEEESKRLSELADKIANDRSFSPDPTPAQPPTPSLRDKLVQRHKEITGEGGTGPAHLDASTSMAASSKPLDHDSVAAEIAALKEKLANRKEMRQPDQAVENAKSEVVRCLREKEKRPLDCWSEVETFKREVGRMEKEFVSRR